MCCFEVVGHLDISITSPFSPIRGAFPCAESLPTVRDIDRCENGHKDKPSITILSN